MTALNSRHDTQAGSDTALQGSTNVCSQPLLKRYCFGIPKALDTSGSPKADDTNPNCLEITKRRER
jgi:hypothetical protein